MRWKKQLSIMILLIIAVSLFAAGAEEEASEGSFNPSGLPIVDESVTLDVVASRASFRVPHKELPMFIELEKASNVKIEWEEIGDAFNEKKNLMLASGDLPDILGN